MQSKDFLAPSPGRVYEELKTLAEKAKTGQWQQYRHGRQVWDYLELGDRRGNWQTFRRAVLCRPVAQDRQRLLDYARPRSILYTNLGRGQTIDQRLAAAGQEHYLKAEPLLIFLKVNRNITLAQAAWRKKKLRFFKTGESGQANFLARDVTKNFL
jgi:hypothetical protein